VDEWMSERLWAWRELCEALSVPAVDGPDISGISIDSRTVKPGELFIALTGDPGARFNPSQRSDRDGHDFVDSALENGAAGVLVHDQKSRDCPQLIVADTLDALWDLGRAGRQRLNCAVVAVTGSSGKTTCKSLLTAALDAFATPGSLNNHLGVPLSLARTPKNVTTAVFEIGTNHPGEIAPLSKLVQPDVAVVLNVHPAHRENFRDMAELRTEKLSISEGLKEDGVLVVHDEIDDGEVPTEIARLRFGESNQADVALLEMADNRARFRVGETGEITAHVPGGGRHRATSLAAVFAVMVALERDVEAACELSDDLIPRGRGTYLHVAGITVIDDSYNANPISMCAALETLAQAPPRRYALLGEMLELGDQSAEFHAGLAEFCRELDGVFCAGEGMRTLVEKLQGLQQGKVVEFWPNASDELIARLKTELRPNDTLLVKGSNRVFWVNDFVSRLLTALAADD